jgi:peptidyl-prolyl cis-trans isomerase B (cyclophilin B)
MNVLSGPWLRPAVVQALLLSTLALGGCAKDRLMPEIGCQATNIPCLEGVATVSLLTTKGTVLVRLDGANAPLTAGNFLDLVRKGTYNNTVFHRVIRTPVPFVVQGGDPLSSDPKVPVSDYGSGQFIEPKTGETRLVPLEFRVKPSRKLVYGQDIAAQAPSVKPVLTHERGAVAMARSDDPNSASAQFYIALEALPELDGRYAVFGRVVGGMDVVDQLQQGDRLIRASLLTN